jgi:membrane protein
MLSFKTLCETTYKALHDTIYHDGIEHAGYIAFLSVLSVFPFLVFFFATASFFGKTEVGTRFIETIIHNAIIPHHVMDALAPRITEIVSGPPQGLLTLSIIGAIWTSSSMVEALRTILNRAYRVHTPPTYIFRRLLSIVQFIIITAIIILVTFLLVIAPNLWQKLQSVISPELWEQINNLLMSATVNTTDPLTIYDTTPYTSSLPFIRYAATSITLFLMVCVSYALFPNIKLRWRNVAPGAIFVIILWGISGMLFTQYLSHFQQVHIIYGSLGGIIGALLFFYFSAMIYVFGAEFNYHYTQLIGRPVEEKQQVP